VLVCLGSAVHAQRGWEWGYEKKLTASDAAADDAFGISVSLCGDTALIGSHWDDDQGHMSGSAYVFVRSGASWVQQAKLTGSLAAAGSQFGRSVSLCDDTALVGAPHMAGGPADPAYVFVRSGTSWSQQAELTPSTPLLGDGFGRSVSLSGDTALVGTPGPGGKPGAAYVFVRSGSIWTQQAKLVASDGSPNDEFGDAVALDGDTVLVGRQGDNDAGPASGSAYVLVRSGSTWSQQAKLVAPGGSAWEYFGGSVAIDGDTALVGATGSYAIWPLAGAAYVFARSGTAWSHQAVLTGSPITGAAFGSSVSLDGEKALIGAEFDDLGNGSTGAAYLFARTGSIWSQEILFEAADAGVDDRFGHGVAFSGHVALIGAWAEDELGNDAGAAYVSAQVPWASVTFRTGGINPASYSTSTLPLLGSTYRGIVDLGGTSGHDFTLLVGYAAPLTLALGAAQIVLVDFTDPNGELLGQVPLSGPVATFDIPIPSDMVLAGFEAFTQALHFGGIQPFVPSNALDLFLGY